MAAKLNSDNVHVLSPRKAKGAGGQKRKGPSTNRSKPRPGESQPAARKPSDQPSDAEVRQNAQNRLIALHQSHRKVEAQMSAASEVMSGLREQKMQIRASIQNSCVPLSIYDEVHKKVTAKTKRADNELYEQQRAMAFEAFGLPCGPEPQLPFDKVPEAARPALHWEDVGYQQAVDGLFADYARDGVPPENYADYTNGFSRGTVRNAAGIGLLKADPPKSPAAAPPLMTGEDPIKAGLKQAIGAIEAGAQPAWEGFDNDHKLWTDAQKDVFTTWFESLDVTAEVDIDHVGAGAMFDEMVEDEQESDAKPQLEPVVAAEEHPTAGDPVAGAAPAGVIYMLSADEPFASGRQATYRDGQPLDTVAAGSYPVYDEHPFEASAEELAKQIGRPGAEEEEAAFED